MTKALLTCERFNLAHVKSELGAQRPAKSATDEELQPKPFQPDLFELNSWLVAALPVLILSDHC